MARAAAKPANPLYERLQWVIAQSNLSANALSENCGLARQHLSTLLDRFRDNPKATFEMRTAIKIQAGTGISIDWLMSGIEPRFVAQRWREGIARYPNLEEAIEAMRAKVLDETIERMRSIAMHYPSDRSVGEWVDEMRDLDSSIRRARKTGDSMAAGRALDDDDDAPPADGR